MLGVCELVGSGHPDKLADQISDALVEFFLEKDPRSKCAFEVVVSKLLVSVVGEYSTRYTVNTFDMEKVVRRVLAPHVKGYEVQRMKIYFGVKAQSLEIFNKCNKGEQLIADQGVCYGYAQSGNPWKHTTEYYIAHLFLWEFELHFGLGDYLKKDFKLLVKTEGDKLKHLTTSIHKAADVDNFVALQRVENLVEEIIQRHQIDTTEDFTKSINFFEIGGIMADSGVTGRKLICDTYGPGVKHGGGALSGKDLSKPDRVLAYFARHVAKAAITCGMCDKCEVRVVYKYGAQTVDELDVLCDGVNTEKAKDIAAFFKQRKFSEIVRDFSKCRSLVDLAKYGHFTDPGTPWESLMPSVRDKLEKFKRPS